jgi:hypothetical protein
MDLDKIAVRLRPRTPYEATDLGFVLVRRFWRALSVGWLAGVLPFFVGAAIISALTPMFWLPLLGLWWLKPLFDRIALFVLSRSFFGDVPELNRTLAHALRGWRTLATLSDLTWRRFNPYRSPAMPVRELEQLRGDEARRRLKLLLRRDVQTPALGLAAVGFIVEWVLVAASVLLLGMVIPDPTGADIGMKILGLFNGDYEAPLLELYVFASYFVCVSVVEVVYVAAGFGLYVNRRVGLEAWDIELVFKRLARRLRRGNGAAGQNVAGRAAAILLLAFSLASLAAPQPAFAQPIVLQETADNNAARQNAAEQLRAVPAAEFDPQAEIRTILEAPEFGHEKIEKEWQLRDDLFDEPDASEASDWSWLEKFFAAVAGVAEVVLWGMAALVLLVALYFILKQVRAPDIRRSGSKPDAATGAEFMAVEEAPRVSLPDDIVDAAMAAWNRGAQAESLSILYRGTIRGLARGYRIEIDPSMTARQSIKMVHGQGGPADYVAELAGAWTRVVYAGRPVAEDRAADLFAAWKRHFSDAHRPGHHVSDRAERRPT